MTVNEELLKNWSDSSSRYSTLIWDEYNSFKKKAWSDLLWENLPNVPKPKVLDVGTGPGFFPILLAEKGLEVTAVDVTDAMIEEAKHNVSKLNLSVDFKVADSRELPFPDGSFDVITSRNVAWTLIEPEKAYGEWFRVLKSGGRTLIFDANWNRHLFVDELREKRDKTIEEYRKLWPDKPVLEYTAEMTEFRKKLPQCDRIRPHWDFGALLDAGFSKVLCDMTIGDRVYDEAEKFFNSWLPFFLLRGDKA